MFHSPGSISILTICAVKLAVTVLVSTSMDRVDCSAVFAKKRKCKRYKLIKNYAVGSVRDIRRITTTSLLNWQTLTIDHGNKCQKTLDGNSFRFRLQSITVVPQIFHARPFAGGLALRCDIILPLRLPVLVNMPLKNCGLD